MRVILCCLVLISVAHAEDTDEKVELKSSPRWKQTKIQKARACKKVESEIKFDELGLSKELVREIRDYHKTWQSECKKPVVDIVKLGTQADKISIDMCAELEKNPEPAETPMPESREEALASLPAILFVRKAGESSVTYDCEVNGALIGRNKDYRPYDSPKDTEPCNLALDLKDFENTYKEIIGAEDMAPLKKLMGQWKEYCAKESKTSLLTVFNSVVGTTGEVKSILNSANGEAKSKRQVAGEQESDPQRQREIEHFGEDGIPEKEVVTMAEKLSEVPGLHCVWNFNDFNCQVNYEDFYSIASSKKSPDVNYFDFLARELPPDKPEFAGCGNMFVGCEDYGFNWPAKFELLKKAKASQFYSANPETVSNVMTSWKNKFKAPNGRLCTCDEIETYRDDLLEIVNYLEDQPEPDQALIDEFRAGFDSYSSGQIIQRSVCGG